MKFYTNTRYPKEKVYEDEKLDWLEEHAGIKFKQFSILDIDKKSIQDDIKKEMVDYFFSDWTEEEDEELYTDEPDLERDLEIADIIYQQNLEKKWGL